MGCSVFPYNYRSPCNIGTRKSKKVAYQFLCKIVSNEITQHNNIISATHYEREKQIGIDSQLVCTHGKCFDDKSERMLSL